MLKFSEFVVHGNDEEHAKRAMRGEDYGVRTERLLTDLCEAPVLLAKSCTDALEAAALVLGIEPGDEVIVPSYTFVSSASAFALRGARIVFVDSRADSWNVDPALVAKAVTPRTKAIVAMHYGGIACDMEALLSFGVPVVEDAAHGFLGTYRHRQLGTIGSLGCYSFHSTKNVSCGEGGALVIGNPKLQAKATEVFDRGTDRATNKSKYSWVGHGSSYRLSNVLAGLLFGQLQRRDEIQQHRRMLCRTYRSLHPVCQKPMPDSKSGYHVFAQLVDDAASVAASLAEHGVQAQQHYLPLHRSKFGSQYGSFDCPVADDLAKRLLRLPLHGKLERRHALTVASLLKILTK